jgi:hypothetical protein
METRISRLHSSSSSLSRSCSPISDSKRRGPSTPVKPSIQRNHSDEEQDPNDRELLTFNDNSKAIIDEISSPMMSDTEENQEKKKSHHRHHHHHHKQTKSNKRSTTTHHRPSAKRMYLF